MKKCEKAIDWIKDQKYGQKVKPWLSPLLKVSIKDISINELVRYEYSIRNKENNSWAKERHFNRQFTFGDPSKYLNQLSK